MNPTPARIGALLLAGALAACSTLPAGPRPTVELPARWSSQASGTATGGASIDSPRWWSAFGSTELDGLVARGLADGFDVKIASQRLEQARGRAQIAGAARYPSIGASVDAGRASGASKASPSISLQAAIDPDLSGRNSAIAASAGGLADAAGFDADGVRASLAAAIAATYFQSLSLNERVRLAQLIADDARKTLGLVETQARLGVASELEVAQQRNAMQTFQAAVPLLEQQRDLATGQLAVLIGAMPEGFQLGAANLQNVQVPDVLASTPANAIARLPEVRSAEAQLRSANFDVAAARAAFLPSVSLAATLGAAFNPAQALWSLAGSVLQPLFDGGMRQGQLRVDRAHAEELVATYRKAIAQALLGAESQMQATRATRDAEQLDEAAVASARRALELARLRLQHGASDFLTVLVSERTLYQAEDAALQVRLQRLQATVALFRALGAGQPIGETS